MDDTASDAIGEAEGAPGIGTGRLEAFSDGVMAVIITIMAFEVRAPLGAGAAALGHRVPALLVYVLSFAFVGIYWNNHHHLLRATRRIGGAAMWANLHLLFWLSLVPVATEWVGSEHGHPWPAAAYGTVALGAAVAFTLLVRAIIGAEGGASMVAEAIGRDFKGYVSIFAYVAAIGLAFLDPWFSYGLFVAVAAMWLIPDRRFIRKGA